VLLAGRSDGVGNVAAAGLGVLTPFCSCSAMPLFTGFVSAGAPLGATFSFLMPEGLLADIMGRDPRSSVPAAVVIGIPMYSNAAGILPVVEALLDKGAALGTTLAFMVSVTALSAPELVILRKVLTVRLIAVFVAVVGLGILAVGYLFNFLFG
jgi:hypothetical protein